MVITELRRTGSGAFEDTPVVFRWSGSEHSSSQGDVSLNLKVTTVRKVIPGGNEVVEQAMHVAWEPFELSGEWNDKFGNRVQPQLAGLRRTGAYALSTFEEFAEMVGRMPEVRVELDALSFVGIIQDLKIKYSSKTYIRWAVTMSPHRNVNVPTARKSELGFSQSVQKWISDVSEQGKSLNTGFKNMLSAVSLKTPQADSFTALLLAINDAIDRLQGISTEGFGTNAEQKLLLTASTFRRLRGACLQAAIALQRSAASEQIAFDDALMSARYCEWTCSSIADVYRTIHLSVAAEADMIKKVGQKPKRLYHPRRNESLEKISAEVYGTPDNWRRIYDANHLGSLVLDGTEELVIPEGAR